MNFRFQNLLGATYRGGNAVVGEFHRSLRYRQPYRRHRPCEITDHNPPLRGPVHGLMFSPTNAVLASSSWDKTVRLWDVFDGKGAVETFQHLHDVLTVAYRPDGKQIACSTLDGQIHFWDPTDGLLMYTIEGRSCQFKFRKILYNVMLFC